MRRRPQDQSSRAIEPPRKQPPEVGEIGLVLSGGGARAAYQVGALKALRPYLKESTHPISTIIGSSIGAINGLLLGACLKCGIDESVEQLELLWRERTFRNTFRGSPSRAFMKAIKIAFLQYMSPGPNASSDSVFDPTPLMQRVDEVIAAMGGLTPEARHPTLRSVGVMTTVEGATRKPMLFLSTHKQATEEDLHGASFEICYVDSLNAKHGFASAALPAILPPVELDTVHGKVRLVDGGISQNVPVDPTVRLGARRVIVMDVSGRDWWLRRYGEALDKRPTWEVPAGNDTFCMRPPDIFSVRCQQPLGPLLRAAVGSTRKFITAVGPTWPIFQLLKQKLGEEVAFETMSYVALDEDYIHALIERGYEETRKLLHHKTEPQFEHVEKAEEFAGARLVGVPA